MKKKTTIESKKRENPLETEMPFHELLARIVRVKPPKKDLK
jgi:hypothetical protein